MLLFKSGLASRNGRGKLITAQDIEYNDYLKIAVLIKQDLPDDLYLIRDILLLFTSDIVIARKQYRLSMYRQSKYNFIIKLHNTDTDTVMFYLSGDGDLRDPATQNRFNYGPQFYDYLK